MNKIIVTVGVAALGAASVQAQYDPGLTGSQGSKAWSVGLSLRGFYDDNYLTVPKSYLISPGVYAHPISAWGTEVTPNVSANHSGENTIMLASYVYDMRWYDDQNNTIDSSHQFNGRVEHEFGPNYKLAVNESFVVAQEPTVIDPTIVTTPLRVPGNNVRNTGNVDFTDDVTKNFAVHLGYANTVYAYQQTAKSVEGYPFGGNLFDGGGVPGYTGAGAFANPSRSADLDRMEQLATLDLRWKATPVTTGILGYQYGQTGFTSSEFIIYPDVAPNGAAYNNGGLGNNGDRSNVRNSESHFVFVGAEQSFSQTLNGSIRAGGEYLDYYNLTSNDGGPTSRLSPYVDASLTDQYAPGDSAQVGVKHVHNTTDLVGVIGSEPVLDAETTAVYVTDSHKLNEKLTVGLMGQAQYSTFVGGGAGINGTTDDFYILQLNFTYHVNPWLMGEAGYNYNRLLSGQPDRAYTRNFVYLGVKAIY